MPSRLTHRLYLSVRLISDTIARRDRCVTDDDRCDVSTAQARRVHCNRAYLRCLGRYNWNRSSCARSRRRSEVSTRRPWVSPTGGGGSGGGITSLYEVDAPIDADCRSRAVGRWRTNPSSRSFTNPLCDTHIITKVRS